MNISVGLFIILIAACYIFGFVLLGASLAHVDTPAEQKQTKILKSVSGVMLLTLVVILRTATVTGFSLV